MIERMEALLREACKGKAIFPGTFEYCPIGHLAKTTTATGCADERALTVLNITSDQLWAFVWGFDGKDICQSVDCEPFRDLGLKLRKEWL